MIAGHPERVLQLLRGLGLLEGILGFPRSLEASPRHTDPFQRRFLELGHTRAPAHQIPNW
ncbi:hypothetical protein ACWGE1_21675 [Streptomyces sp. NPDC054932]